MQFTESGALNNSQNDSKRKRVSPFWGQASKNSHFGKNSRNLDFKNNQLCSSDNQGPWETGRTTPGGRLCHRVGAWRGKTVILVKTVRTLLFTIKKQPFLQFRHSGALKNSQNDSGLVLVEKDAVVRRGGLETRLDYFSRLLTVWTAQMIVLLL